MQSVTSNAVAEAIGGQWEKIWENGRSFIQGTKTKLGRFLRIRFDGAFAGTWANGNTIIVITNQDYLPTLSPNRFVFTVDTTSQTRMNASADFLSDGGIRIYFQDRVAYTESVSITGCYCDVLLLLL